MFGIQRLDFLIALYIFCIAAAEFLGAKTFPITKIGDFQLNASVAIFVIPLVFSINDIIAEVYGKERARSVVRSGIIIVAFIFLFAMFATILPPSVRFAKTEAAYDTIFGLSARFAFASLTAFAVADLLDVYIFSKLREKLGKGKLWLRTNASNIISQFIDTTLFMFLAFYALDKSFNENLPFLLGIIIPYWLLKCTMSLITTPFVYAGVQWLKREKNK